MSVEGTSQDLAPDVQFAASAPAKVNLHLGVGEARADGYHDLVSVFHAVDQRDIVRLRLNQGTQDAKSNTGVISATAAGTPGSVVTRIDTKCFFDIELEENLDTPNNLAWRAVDAVVDAYRAENPGASLLDLPKVRIEIEKGIFVAGGMAGGSADAAAALVAANAYLKYLTGSELDELRLVEIAKNLGADVPFALMGGNAIGTGRGDELVEMLGRGEFWWVFVNLGTTISTAEAFSRLDDMRHNNPALVPHLDTTKVAQALTTGDAFALGSALHNDLQDAAVAMRPELARLIQLGNEYGVRAVVSGSGPTVAVLCRDEQHAKKTHEMLGMYVPEGGSVIAAPGPATGAVLL